MNDLRDWLRHQSPAHIVPPHDLVNMALDNAEQRRTAKRRRIGGITLASAAAVAALTAATPGHNLPNYIAGTVATGMSTCGRVPEPAGPKADLLRATLSAPAQAESGERLDVTVNLSSTTGRPMSVSTGIANVLIVRDGWVVGKYPDDGGVGDPGIITGPIEGNLAGIVPGIAYLLGCPAGPTDPMAPNASRPKLQPGDYGLVGVTVDNGENGSDRTVIVSAPTMVRVS